MLQTVVLTLVLVAGAFGSRCYLPNIPVKNDIDEVRLAGRWFELKWHAASNARLALFSGKYSDQVMDLTAISPYTYYSLPATTAGFAIREAYYDAIKGSCEVKTGAWNRVAAGREGKYRDTIKIRRFPTNQVWIMDTDYTNWMIEFQCLRVAGDYCEASEIQIHARTPDYSKEILRRAEHRLRELLTPNPCVSYAYIIRAPHTRPSRCVSALTTTAFPYGYGMPGPVLYNYFGANAGLAGVGALRGMHGGLLTHPELIEPYKAVLVADRAKLIAEKAKLEVYKEKLQLEIARLRGISPLAADTGYRAGHPKA